MSITLSYLTVTPTWSSKKLTVEGSAAVRESVALRITGCGTDTSVVFKLSSEDGRVDYAKFPNLEGDAWTVDGSDLTGTLSLNTDLLVAAFAALGPTDCIDLVCTVASRTSLNLFAIGRKTILNWMEDADDPVAYSTPLADAVSDLETAFAAHTHNGTDAPKVSHTDLTNIGSNTHPQIDAALTSIAASIVTLTQGVNTNAGNITNLGNAVTALDTVALKTTDFSAVADITLSTATVKKLAAKINEILAILKG